MTGEKQNIKTAAAEVMGDGIDHSLSIEDTKTLDVFNIPMMERDWHNPYATRGLIIDIGTDILRAIRTKARRAASDRDWKKIDIIRRDERQLIREFQAFWRAMRRHPGDAPVAARN